MLRRPYQLKLHVTVLKSSSTKTEVRLRRDIKSQYKKPDRRKQSFVVETEDVQDNMRVAIIQGRLSESLK